MIAKSDEQLRKQLEKTQRGLLSAIYIANEYEMKVIADWEKAGLKGKLQSPYKRISCFNDKIKTVHTISLKGEAQRKNFAFICLDFVSSVTGVKEGNIERREIGQGLCLEVPINSYLGITFYITCFDLPICQMIEKETVYKSTVYVCTE